MADTAAVTSDVPKAIHPATVPSSITIGMTNANNTAFVPTDDAAITFTSCPNWYCEVSAQRTSISFSLLSAEEQCDAILQL